jgi:hypothetical protein
VIPIWLSLTIVGFAIGGICFGLGVWWGKLHPSQAATLLSDADKALQIAKKLWCSAAQAIQTYA